MRFILSDQLGYSAREIQAPVALNYLIQRSSFLEVNIEVWNDIIRDWASTVLCELEDIFVIV